MEKLREQLANVINNSELPFECKYYVLKDVFNEVNNVYRNLLNQEKNKEITKKEENLQEEGKTE